MGAVISSGSEDRLVGADRVLAVLVELAAHPRGVTLDDLATAMASPKPSVHRALTSLRRAGLAAQISRGLYILGDEFLRLAFDNAAQRPDAQSVTPVLERLTEMFGETAHYAVLEHDEVIYRAKTDPVGNAVRLTSVVGGRNPAHCTAVGKLLLSERVDDRLTLEALLGPGPYLRRTSRTLTTPETLWAELELIRSQGYAVDDQENEPGINCVAVPLPARGTGVAAGAVSVSALAFRTPLDKLVREVPPAVAAILGAPSGA